MASPKVSVVIPTANRPELLQRAIDSVLAQTYQDFEIIVVDDGQKVRADQVVKAFNDPRIRYVQNDTPKGGGGTRNIGAGLAMGEYIAFLDDDDEWKKEKLEKQVDALSETKDACGFCFTAVRVVSAENQYDTEVLEGERDFSDIALTNFKGFMTSGLMIKKGVFEEVGGFDPLLPSHQEAELMIRVSEKFTGVGINQPLVFLNMLPHEHIGGNVVKRIQGRTMLLRKHIFRYAAYPDKLAKCLFRLAVWYRDAGEYYNSLMIFRKVFILQPNLRNLSHIIKVSMMIMRDFFNNLLASDRYARKLAGRIYMRCKLFGFKYYCPFCVGGFRSFYPAGFELNVLRELDVISAGKRNNVRCPSCNSSERERLMYFYIKKHDLDGTRKITQTIHIAPEAALQKRLKHPTYSAHTSIDLSSPIADIHMDIHDIKFSSDSFDLLICSNVMEHIPDDIKVLREMLRVLRSGGTAMFMVPISEKIDRTFENWEVTTEADRERVFGQTDHVRIYSYDFAERLEKSGFEVTQVKARDFLPEETIERYALNPRETIFVAKKP